MTNGKILGILNVTYTRMDLALRVYFIHFLFLMQNKALYAKLYLLGSGSG
jgi:hypothetical protein